jgi:hypothetical protein
VIQEWVDVHVPVFEPESEIPEPYNEPNIPLNFNYPVREIIWCFSETGIWHLVANNKKIA